MSVDLLATIYCNFNRAHLNFSRNLNVLCAQQVKATAKVQCWQPEAKTTEVQSCMACNLQLQTINGRLWCKLWTVVEIASGKGHAETVFGDSAHDLSVKLSPCMFSPVAVLAGEMTAICCHM